MRQALQPHLSLVAHLETGVTTIHTKHIPKSKMRVTVRHVPAILENDLHHVRARGKRRSIRSKVDHCALQIVGVGLRSDHVSTTISTDSCSRHTKRPCYTETK